MILQVRPAHHRREKVCSPGLQSERHALALQAPSFQHLSTSRKLESFQLVFQREDCEKLIKNFVECQFKFYQILMLSESTETNGTAFPAWPAVNKRSLQRHLRPALWK